MSSGAAPAAASADFGGMQLSFIGEGHGEPAASALGASRPPTGVRVSDLSADGPRLAKDIQPVVRAHADALRACQTSASAGESGKAIVAFVVDANGKVSKVRTMVEGSLGAVLTTCFERVYAAIDFGASGSDATRVQSTLVVAPAGPAPKP